MAASDDATVDSGHAETLESKPPSAAPEVVPLPPPFVFRRELSRGGMGRVLIAWDERHGREVAIKIMRGVSPDLAARFRREAQVTARLQHPAIVPVYDSGLLPDGEPFYAMRLVSGRSLDGVIENRRIHARLAILPQLIAAADAVAYAHANHVVHRDLKPQNILVGRFGETVVIDWGLAKDLVADVPSPPLEGAPSGTSGLTLAGSIIGTPAYMPPEQARGQDVDERADVYSLGALIYFVLQGAPPFDGPTSEMVLSAVIEGPPPPLANDVPADLRAIVQKAMSRDPQSRYPSAAELAEDLKKFQTGKLVAAHSYSFFERVRRVTARQRAAVAVGAILLLLMMALSAIGVRRIAHERDVANLRRTEAQTARSAAEALVGYLVIELAERLERLGWIELLKGIGEAVVRYEESTAKVRADELPSSRQARALELVAEAEGPRGDRATAERALRASLQIRKRLAAVAPSDPAARRDLVHAEWILFEQLEEHGGATPEVMEWVAREPSFVAESRTTSDPELLEDLAETLRTVGHVRELTAEIALEETSLRAAVAAAERGIALAPKSPVLRRILAQARSELADTVRRAGRLREAKEEKARALALFDALASEHESDPRFQHALWMALHNAAQIASYDEADALSARALPIILDLTRRHPENFAYHQSHVLTIDLLGGLAFDEGHYPAAKKRFQEQLHLIEELRAAGFDTITLDGERGHALQCLAWIEIFDKRPEAAIAPMLEAVAIEERFVTGRPGDLKAELDLVESLGDLGYAELRARRFGDAVSHLERAAAMEERTLSRAPADRQWSIRGCFIFAWLGESLAGAGRRDESEKWLKKTIAAAAPLFDQPRSAEDPELVSAVVEGTGIAVEILGAEAPAQARRLLEQSLVVAKQQAARGELYASALTEIPRWERAARAHR